MSAGGDAQLVEDRARGTSLQWVPAAVTVLTIATVIGVTLWQLHPSLLITNTTTTGGDTGAHIALPTGPGFNVQLDPAKIESQTMLKPE